MTRRNGLLIALLFAALLLEISAPKAAIARVKGAVELGMDGSIGVRDFEGTLPDAFFISLPISSIRAGYYVSDRVAVEPSLGFQLIRIDNESLSELDFDLGLLLSLDDIGKSTPFFRVAGGILSLNSDVDADTQYSAGAAAGVRIPTGDQFAVRLQLGMEKNWGDLLDSTDIAARFGFSFFTR